MTDRPYGAPRRIRNLLFAMVMLAAPAQAEVRVLAFGDSLTAGYGIAPEFGFTAQLQDWLRAHGVPDATVINGGVSGDTTAGGLARIDWTLGENPDAVIIELGANDFLRGLDPGAARANLDGIMAAVQKRGLPMILAGIPVLPNFGPEYQAEFKALYPDLAQKYDAILYPSFFNGITKGGGTMRIMGLLQGDGLHPNARGVQMIVEDIGPVVLRLIEQVK